MGPSSVLWWLLLCCWRKSGPVWFPGRKGHEDWKGGRAGRPRRSPHSRVYLCELKIFILLKIHKKFFQQTLIGTTWFSVRGYVSQSAHFKNWYFPEKKPNSTNSSPTMGIRIILCIKQKWRLNLRWFLEKMEKSKCNAYSINQSIID